MRVISGKFKKKKLLLPDPKITRPLRDYIKESIFNLLTHSKILNFEFKAVKPTHANATKSIAQKSIKGYD